MGFWSSIGNGITGALSKGWDTVTADPGTDAEKQRKSQLYGQAAAAGDFAQQQQSQFGALQRSQANNVNALQRVANGQNSVSAEQLRQATAANQAQQMSMAAGAGGTPNAAGAARTAAIQAGRLGAGLAGQQAVAGLQERQQAQSSLANALGTYGGQALSAAQGARGQAIQGYGSQEAGAPEQSWLQKYGGAIIGGASVASDRKLKTDVRPADDEANDMLDGLRAYKYRYKDEDRFGKGEQFGVMAQDLERAGLKSAVTDTPAGKIVNGAKLAAGNTAMIAALHKRIKVLEDRS
jgi:hypothetical protein